MAGAVVLQAWDFILDRIGRICSAQNETKCTTDCVTELDRMSETPIVDAIRKRFPDYHIVAEETSDKVLQRGVTWIIDPLDGTTNFIHGFPFIAVSISVCIEQQLLSGFALEAVHQDFFTATKERSAFDKNSISSSRSCWNRGARCRARSPSGPIHTELRSRPC